jgi:hypothetical protein
MKPVSDLMDKWRVATVYHGQTELHERERYYMDGLVKKGFEVRYDDKYVYNSMDGEFIISIMRVNLQPRHQVKT